MDEDFFDDDHHPFLLAEEHLKRASDHAAHGRHDDAIKALCGTVSMLIDALREKNDEIESRLTDIEGQ